MEPDYIDTPCPCEQAGQCPHYGRLLVGRLWELSRMENELGRSYRELWVRQRGERDGGGGGGPPTKPKPSGPKPCNCGRKLPQPRKPLRPEGGF